MDVEIKLDPRFKRSVSGRFGKYDFKAGVLQDKPHRSAKRGKPGLGGKDVLSSYAGGPTRKTGRNSGLSVAQVSEENRNRMGVNYLTEPFKKKSADLNKFLKSFFDLAFGRSQKRRAENALQAVIRNPMLKGDYGPNSPLTRKIKGFDRAMIDTAQLFKAIKAKCTIRSRK